MHQNRQKILFFLSFSALFLFPINFAYGYSDFIDFLDKDSITYKNPYYSENQTTDSPPEAKLKIISDSDISDKLTGTLATEFTFDGSSSTDLETPMSKLEVRFDFDNDGTFDTYFTRRKRTTHSYETTGTKRVRLQVIDGSGNIDEVVKELKVVNNTKPNAYFTVSDYVNVPSKSFIFKTDRSSDDQYEKTSLKYRFDWDNDNVYDTGFSKLSTHRKRFDNPGKKSVKMQVIDKEGLTDTFSREIIVLESTDPVASFKITPEFGYFSTTFILNATNSYDEETDIDNLYFRWDLDYQDEDDISFDRPYIHDSTTKVHIKTPGIHYILLEVKDTEGNIDRSVKSIKIHWAAEYFDYLRRLQIITENELDFDADRFVSRERISRYVVKALDKIEIIDYRKPTEIYYYDRFNDISINDNNWGYIYKMVDLGLFKGYSDGYFRPDLNITRIDAVKLILEAFERDLDEFNPVLPYKDIKPDYWFYDIVKTAYLDGIITEQEYFRPGDFITEGEFAKVLNLAIERYEKK